uniref:B30.2/SPRY domain-containing protein n=1 Tax=Parastrongyloides trichosuri TaxID=131310 RepID=A0A0N4ZXL5_PARTI
MMGQMSSKNEIDINYQGNRDIMDQNILGSRSLLPSASNALRRVDRLRINLLEFARQSSSFRNFPTETNNIKNRRKIGTTRRINDDPVDIYDADICCPYKFKLIKNSTLPSQSIMEEHAWNQNDRSLNIFVKEDDPLTFHRHPVAQSTDCIRGKVGYNSGFHVWKIIWPLRQRGTHAVIGVATSEAKLHAIGYTSLIGSTKDSYGWDIVKLKCSHDGIKKSQWNYPNEEWENFDATRESFSAPESIYCILDMDEGYMAYATDDEYLGVAFRNLKGKTLFPIVSAVWGHCEITMKYMGGIPPEAPTLLSTSRKAIRKHFGRKNMHRIPDLNLPSSCIDYLMYK